MFVHLEPKIPLLPEGIMLEPQYPAKVRGCWWNILWRSLPDSQSSLADSQSSLADSQSSLADSQCSLPDSPGSPGSQWQS